MWPLIQTGNSLSIEPRGRVGRAITGSYVELASSHKHNMDIHLLQRLKILQPINQPDHSL